MMKTRVIRLLRPVTDAMYAWSWSLSLSLVSIQLLLSISDTHRVYHSYL